MKTETIKPMPVVDDIVCDICGSSVIPNAFRQHSDNVNDFCAYAKLTASFGYGSARDGEEQNFDFCEACFDAILTKVNDLKREHADKD